MRWDRVARRLALAVAPLFGTGDRLAAQRWEPPAGVAARAATGSPAPSHPRSDSAAAAPTTLGQRYWTGLGLGGAAAIMAGQATGHRDVTLAAYLAGCAGGVLLAGHAREGARPVPVLLGTMAGAAPFWLALARSRRSDGLDPHLGLLFLSGILTTPLGGAVGHELGGPRRGAEAAR